jgi:hypothetical protein
MNGKSRSLDLRELRRFESSGAARHRGRVGPHRGLGDQVIREHALDRAVEGARIETHRDLTKDGIVQQQAQVRRHERPFVVAYIARTRLPLI